MKTTEIQFQGNNVPLLGPHRVTFKCVTHGYRDALVLFQNGYHTLLYKRSKSAARSLFPDRSDVIRSDQRPRILLSRFFRWKSSKNRLSWFAVTAD